MSYATFTPIQALTKLISNKMDPTDYGILASQAMTSADQRVENRLKGNDITPPDSDTTLTEASNLFAATKIIDAYYAGKDKRSPSSISYESEANEVLDEFISNYENENETIPFKVVGTYSYDKDFPSG